MSITATERYIQSARDAGCPRDQIERFVSAGYVSLPQILPYHAACRALSRGEWGVGGATPAILLDGTRGSAKSHAVIAQTCIDDCQVYPGLKVIFLRKTQKAAEESFTDLVGRVLRNVPHKANSEKIEFSNGSRVMIGGYKDDGDIAKYIGIEYDKAVIEEATQIRGDQMDMFMGSIRTSRTDWTPRIELTTNPGGIGHSHIKERFIIPHREHRETNTRRFFSSYKDNPFINIEYKRYLEGLTGDLAKAWRDGDWDIFAGQAFSQWREELDGKPWHVIEPFEIPANWFRFMGVDYGYTNPFAAAWNAKDPNTGRIYLYRTLKEAGLTDRQQARMILDLMHPGEMVREKRADPSMFAKKTGGDFVTTTADEYGKEGVYLLRGDNDRINRKRKFDRLLAPLADGLPGLQVFKTCLDWRKDFPALVYDDHHPEDIDTTGDDHLYDAEGYAFSSIGAQPQSPREVKPNPWLSPHLRGVL